MISINKIQEIVKHYCIDNALSKVSVYLFGSYAKGKAHEKSDVDLLCILDQDVYNYENSQTIKECLKNKFESIGIYCEPIFGYLQYINEDRSVLYRQYIGYGQLLYGDDISKLMIQETKEEQTRIEYEKYWKAAYLEKIRTIEYFIGIDKNINESTLCWQYLYLIAYWYAKAELTLVNKQHSLNEYSLNYIYTELLALPLDEKASHTLEIVQSYRDKIRNDDYFDNVFEAFVVHFEVIKKLIA
jgi:predicted nucleotidyltransferase